MNGRTDDDSILATVHPAADPYDDLPEPIRMAISRTEYLWLGDADKARLEQDFCDPDPEFFQ